MASYNPPTRQPPRHFIRTQKTYSQRRLWNRKYLLSLSTKVGKQNKNTGANVYISALESLKQKKLCNFKTSRGYHGILGQPGLQFWSKRKKKKEKSTQTNQQKPHKHHQKTQQVTIITLPQNLCLQSLTSSTLTSCFWDWMCGTKSFLICS